MVFEARFHGRCLCGEQIYPGDEVCYDEDELVRVGCFVEADEDSPESDFS